MREQLLSVENRATTHLTMDLEKEAGVLPVDEAHLIIWPVHVPRRHVQLDRVNVPRLNVHAIQGGLSFQHAGVHEAGAVTPCVPLVNQAGLRVGEGGIFLLQNAFILRIRPASRIAQFSLGFRF